MTVKRRSRRRTAPLTAERIETAALGIVDREGVDALTMRRLGAELGVEAMSLYYHVPTKDVLLGRVASRVAGEVTLDVPPDAPWRDGLRALGVAMRAALQAHPRAVPIVATRPLDPEAGRRFIGPVLGPLLAGGFAEATAFLAIQSVAAFVIGHALAEAGAGEEVAPDDPQDRSYYDRWFDLGLNALIRGLDPSTPEAEPQRPVDFRR